jgi:DNA-binding MarR family transcriptional regulator
MTGYRALARDLLLFRRNRDAMFGRDLFADPAWDMLLELYLAAEDSQPFMVSNLGASAGVPPTTALRWTSLLLERGLIERTPDRRDARRVLVTLTGSGRDLMDQLLGSLADGRSNSARTISPAIDTWAAATANPS